MALATLACFDRRARSSRSQLSSSATSGADWRCLISSRASGLCPLTMRSISNNASMRVTASTAMGEISLADLPLRMLVCTSASSKNLRRACDQHNADATGPGFRVVSYSWLYPA